MKQTGHWKDEDLNVVHLSRLLARRFEQVDFAQARSEVRPFIRDDAELALWDRTFFMSLAGRITDDASAGVAQPGGQTVDSEHRIGTLCANNDHATSVDGE